VASLVMCLSLVVGLLVLEKPGFIEIDEKEIQPEVVSCQIGHRDMEVSVFGSRDYLRGEVVPRSTSPLLIFGSSPIHRRPVPCGRSGSLFHDKSKYEVIGLDI
jgi:hypothetical protein